MARAIIIMFIKVAFAAPLQAKSPSWGMLYNVNSVRLMYNTVYACKMLLV